MDYEKMTITELKAAAFDIIAQLEPTQRKLNEINQMILKKLAETDTVVA